MVCTTICLPPLCQALLVVARNVPPSLSGHLEEYLPSISLNTAQESCQRSMHPSSQFAWGEVATCIKFTSRQASLWLMQQLAATYLWQGPL